MNATTKTPIAAGLSGLSAMIAGQNGLMIWVASSLIVSQ